MRHRIKHRASRETGVNMKTGITGFMEQSPIRMAGKKKRLALRCRRLYR
jgi:hypothetical protein